ncbi:hypothetical protein FB566_4641 [Stackebrandtia endophytica]|uniref:Uncharacterized protein n=1 Tax=Stackebrandtia endophytica TaxID=1496996 RepID=A0A543B2R5_9ACTN|nr:hypothetical protein [Stackebrandtia endophytica]TQL79040.1 hypothetical protein FB566_4641 [Stackebrandtia endophytica]
MSEQVEDFKSFIDAYKDALDKLNTIAVDQITEEAASIAAGIAPLYRMTDIYDGAGRIDMYNNIDLAFGFDYYIDQCCFPDVDCTDIDEAINVISRGRDSFDIEANVGMIYAGLNTWNTEKYAELNEGGALGVTEGPAETFRKHYVESINPTALNQHDMMDSSVEVLKGYRTLVTENRQAILDVLDEVTTLITEYDPWDTAWLAAMHGTITAVGLIIGTTTAGIGTLAADLIATKIAEELGLIAEACVVEVLQELVKSIDVLTENRTKVVADLATLVNGLTEEADTQSHRFVCRRPSQLRETAPPINV